MQNLAQSAEAIRVAIEAMPVGVSWANLADQKILFMNRKFTEIFGYKRGDFVDIADWVEKTYLYAEDRALVAKTWGTYLAAPDGSEYAIEPIEIRVLCKNGEIKTILNSGVILPETGWALATFVDISDRKRNELQLRAAERRAAENEAIYRLLLDHSPEMIILSPFNPSALDQSPVNQSRRYVSSAVKQITGFTAEEYLALNPLDTFHPDDRGIAERVLNELRAGKLEHVFRYRVVHKDGGYSWVEAILTGYVDPASQQASGYVATVRDIAEEVRREEQLVSEYRALSEAAALDELTGIANRRAFNRAVEGEAVRQSRSTRELSLLMVDVDYFKGYNDLYGHLAGDACLKAIATALKQVLRRGSDLAARIGGDEFVVLMPMTESTGAEVVATKLVETISALVIPHAQSPHRVVTVSIGVSSWPAEMALDAEALIEKADRALYRAKEGGRNQYAVG
jgi:diguanylate cyclase (GGDEF)-like protein/PAS domain S-box-containing protein